MVTSAVSDVPLHASVHFTSYEFTKSGGAAVSSTEAPLGNPCWTKSCPETGSTLMPAGELTTEPPETSMLTVSVNIAAGGGGLPPPVSPAPLPPPGPVFSKDVGQPPKTMYGPLTMTVQLSSHTGLLPLAAKKKGSPTPPELPPTKTLVMGLPCGVSEPLLPTRKAPNWPLPSIT